MTILLCQTLSLRTLHLRHCGSQQSLIWCRSEIEECPDQDTSKMQAKLSIVPINQLSLFIGKKVNASKLGLLGFADMMHK